MKRELSKTTGPTNLEQTGNQVIPGDAAALVNYKHVGIKHGIGRNFSISQSKSNKVVNILSSGQDHQPNTNEEIRRQTVAEQYSNTNNAISAAIATPQGIASMPD